METPNRKKTYIANSSDFLKKLNHSKSMGNNLTSTFNSFPQKSKNTINNESTKEKSKIFLIAHKINFKDKKNNFYKKGIKEFFNNENYFFETRYHNHKIRIGNSESRFYTPEQRINYNIMDKKIFVKKRTNNNLNRKYSLSSNQINTLNANALLKNKLNDSNMSILSKYGYYKKPTNNNALYMKRPSIFFNDKEFITDNELKNLFQKFKIKKSRNEKNYFSKSTINFNTSLRNEINNRIDLQGKILENYKKNERKGSYIINRIKKITNKENKDLLIKQVDKYRFKIEQINNSSLRKKNYENYNRVIQWLSSLRKYDNNTNKKNISKKNEEVEQEISLNNNNNIENNDLNNNTNINFNNTNFYKTISSSNKEQILDNYINKFHYSFGNNSSLYSDIESNITPLYALILPQDNKNKETIKNSSTYEESTLPLIIGKNLLDYEIGLSKYLEGKKKIIIKNKYNEDDIKPLILSNTKGMERFHIPRAVTNAFDLHFNK